jgi:hypothetical protein
LYLSVRLLGAEASDRLNCPSRSRNTIEVAAAQKSGWKTFHLRGANRSRELARLLGGDSP